MKNLLLSLLMAIVSVNGLAQRYSTEFGKVGKDELDLVSYDKDTSAEAVILYDIGMSRFIKTDNGFEVIFEHSKRIKILNESGMNYAEFEIPYYRSGNIFEKVIELEAITYNFENGMLTKTLIDESTIHDEKVNDYWNVKKVAMPNVKKGSIIEFRYKLSSQDVFNLRNWVFQDKIPTVYSQFTTKMIPFYEYTYALQGASKFDSQKSYQSKELPRVLGTIEYNDYVYEFLMKDVPAFKSETYITSMNDYIIKVIFQLAKINYPKGGSKIILSTWPDLIEELIDNSDFGRFVTKSEKLAEKTIDVKSLTQKPQRERFEEVIKYVKNNFKWNEYYGKYASKSPANVIKDKFGNVADLNLLTIGFLNAIGIEAYPVLISTRKNGKVMSDYPFLKYFNYVLIYVKLDDGNILSDVTDFYCSPYRIPERCINESGLLIKESDSPKWIGLQSSLPTETKTVIDFFLEDDNLRANVEISANEYEAVSFKEEIGNDIDKLLEHLKEKNYNVPKDSLSISFQKDANQPYKFSFKPELQVELINNKIYIDPFLNEPLKDNPLNQETRTYPVDMIYPWRDTYVSTIYISNDYNVEYVPEDFRFSNNLAEVEYKVEQNENTLKITLSCFFKQAEYAPKEYSKLKFYLNQVIKKGNEKVVLVKN